MRCIQRTRSLRPGERTHTTATIGTILARLAAGEITAPNGCVSLTDHQHTAEVNLLVSLVPTLFLKPRLHWPDRGHSRVCSQASLSWTYAEVMRLSLRSCYGVRLSM